MLVNGHLAWYMGGRYQSLSFEVHELDRNLAPVELDEWVWQVPHGGWFKRVVREIEASLQK